jgi:UDP:flavonoid glycosyltransferase YjiC (YdhE family)
MKEMKKKIYIICGGSRGDIQPMLVFSKIVAKNMNVDITIFANKRYGDWMKKEGFQFQSLVGGIENRFDDVEVADALIKGSPDVTLRLVLEDMNGYTKDMLTIKEYCDNISRPDLFICGPVVISYVHNLAEYCKIPFGVIGLFPLHQTTEFPACIFGVSDLYLGILNWCSYYVSIFAMWFLLKKSDNEWRKMLGLAPEPYFKTLDINALNFFYAFSKQIIAPPKDWPSERIEVGGYLFYDNEIESLHPKVEEFLKNGDKPVYIGFGSMNLHLSHSFTDLIEKTIEGSETTRFIIAIPGITPFTKEQPEKYQGFVSERVLLIGSSPHHLLFPRCKVIVHHGGAGTTSAALRSGTPSVICHVLADQPFWGHRTSALKCCAGYQKFSRVTSEWLHEKIQLASTPEYVAAAKHYAEKLKKEKCTCVDWVKSLLT